MTTYELISSLTSIIVISGVIAGGLRILLTQAKKNATRLTKLEVMVESCHTQLTNHIPHKLQEIDLKIDQLDNRLIAHEAKEEVYWKLVSDRYEKENGQAARDTTGTG